MVHTRSRGGHLLMAKRRHGMVDADYYKPHLGFCVAVIRVA